MPPKIETEFNAKDHIRAIFEGRAKNDLNSVSLANALSKDIATGFAGGMNYIYELLQNADDSTEESISVQFKLIGQHLIVSHTGRHFTAEDIERICGYAEQTHTEKAEDINKTGYKGIGFKAIFSISDWVGIFSNEFQLRFDKNYEQWQTGFALKRPYPWQIIPIWTERDSLTNDLQAQVTNQQVVFIIRLQSPALVEKVKNDFQHFAKHPEIALFLRNTKAIRFSAANFNYQISQQAENNLKTLSVNGERLAQWWLHHYSVEIPKKIHEQLEILNDYQCPPKLKRAQKVIVSIAYRVSADKLDRLKAQAIYTYLPTSTDLGLPFIINGDFILNPERTGLVVNEWNQFLLGKIPLVHLASLKTLSKTAFRPSLLTVLAEAQLPYTVSNQPFHTIYHEAFIKALERVDFLPAAVGEQNLKLNQCHVDSLVLSQAFPQLKIPEVDIQTILAHDLQETNRLHKLPTFNLRKQQIGWSQHIANLANYAEQLREPTENCRLVCFMAKAFGQHSQYERTEHLERLCNTTFIISQQGKLQKPKHLYFQPESGSANPPLAFDLHYVHTQLAADETCREFLLELGVSQCSSLELVERYVIDELLTQSKPEKLIVLLQFVFNVHRVKNLEPRHFKALSNIQLVTSKQKVAPATALFLGDAYRSEQTRLDQYFSTEDVMVSPSYLRTDDTASEWQQFFKGMGVNTPDTIIVKRDYTYERGMQEFGSEFAGYYRSLGVRGSSNVNPNDYLRIFITIPLLGLKLKNTNTARLFWQLLVSNIDHLISHKTTTYCYANATNKKEVDSFLIYQLRQTVCLPDQAGTLHRASDLYSPEFAPFTRFGLSVANVPISLPDRVVEFVGFRRRLPLTESCKILRGLSSTESLEFIITAHRMVLNSMLSQTEQSIPTANLKLLAMDNTLQPVTQLQYRVVNGHVVNPSQWLKQYDGFDTSQMMRLCQMLQIKIIEKISIEFRVQGSREEFGPINTVLQAIPFLALLESRSTGRQVKECVTSLYQSILQLKAHEVSDLIIIEAGMEKSISYYFHDTTLYFKGRWNRTALKNNLISEIGRYLKLSTESFSRLLTVVSLSDNDASNSDRIEWLEENGFDKELYSQVVAQFNELIMSDSAVSSSALLVPTGDRKSEDSELAQAFGDLSIESEATHSTANSIGASAPLTNASKVDPETPKQTVRFSRMSPGAGSNLPEIIEFIPQHTPDKPIDLTKLAAKRYQAQARQVELLGFASPVFSGNRERMQSSNASRNKEIQTVSDTAKFEIGRWGEARIYHYLKAYYPQKTRYQNWRYQETNVGFELISPDQKSHLAIVWANKKGESGLPYDIKITRTDINGKNDERIIEVKSTTASCASELFISGNEWTIMLNYKARYRLFRVRGAGSDESLEILKIKDPAKQIRDGVLQPHQAIFRC